MSKQLIKTDVRKMTDFINNNKGLIVSKALELTKNHLEFFVNDSYTGIVGDVEIKKGTFKNVDVDFTIHSEIYKEMYIVIPYYYRVLWSNTKTYMRIKDFYLLPKEAIN